MFIWDFKRHLTFIKKVNFVRKTAMFRSVAWYNRSQKMLHIYWFDFDGSVFRLFCASEWEIQLLFCSSSRGQFHQRVYAQLLRSRSQKRKKLLNLTVFLVLLWSACVKAARKMLVKLTRLVVSTNNISKWVARSVVKNELILRQAFFAFLDLAAKNE